MRPALRAPQPVPSTAEFAAYPRAYHFHESAGRSGQRGAGRALVPCLRRPGMVVYLDGDLGAGKTTLVRAMLAGARSHGGR